MNARRPTIALAQLLPALPAAAARICVSGLADDSRRVSPGDLFLAYPGESVDGRLFVEAAVAAGAVAVFYEAEGAALPALSVPAVAVPGLRAQLSAIAGRYWGQPAADLRLLGVTGTNGKSTCSYLLAQLYQAVVGPCGVIGTLGWGLPGADWRESLNTTPGALALQQMLAELRAEGARAVSMEVSSHALVQGRVAGLPMDAALFTNLSRDHLDYHGDMAAYAAAKASLFAMPGLRYAVLNADDPASEDMARRCAPGVQQVRYGLRDESAEVRAGHVRYNGTGTTCHVITPWGEGELSSPLWGEFNLYNSLGVIALLAARGLPLTELLRAFAGLQPVPGRLQSVPNRAGLTVLVDYAHTPDALRAVLAAVRPHVQGQLWCVFGCGGDRDPGKRPLMGEVAVALADRVLVTSDNPRSESPAAIISQVLQGAGNGAVVVESRGEAIARAIAQAVPGDCVLIAGKGHEDYQEIRDVRHHFSDVEEAGKALMQREAA